MIVAIALSALVSLIGAMALGASTDFYARSGTRLQGRADMRSAERMLQIEWESRSGKVVLTGDALEFMTTTSVGMLPLPGVARVRYQCQPGEDEKITLTNEVLPLPAPAGAPPEPVATANAASVARVEPLVAGLSACAIEALRRVTDSKGRTTQVWVRQWSDKEDPPQLIRLQVLGDWGETPAAVFVARKAPA